MSGQDKFSKRRNAYRKVYGFQRLPRDERTFLDQRTNLYSTVDLSRFIVDRDYFIIGELFKSSLQFAEYEEDLITLNYEDTKTITFKNAFSDVPIVVLDVWPDGENTDFIVSYIVSVTTTTLTVAVSAITNGTLRYKALNLPTNVSYPVKVTRSPLFPNSTAVAEAGIVHLNNEYQTTISYPGYASLSPGNASDLIVTAKDNSNDQANIYIKKENATAESAELQLSSHFSGSISFIVMKE